MPQELAGFYYDEEKNRYFPLRGPIPGSSSRPSTSSSSHPPAPRKSSSNTDPTVCKKKRMRLTTPKLLHCRELNADLIPCTNARKGNCNFVEELHKLQASNPLVWKYKDTRRLADSGLDRIHLDLQTAQGQNNAEVLITGGLNGFLSLFEVAKVGQGFRDEVECVMDRVWPPVERNQAEFMKSDQYILNDINATVRLNSSISCIRSSGKHALITSLGEETSGGFLYVLSLGDTLAVNSGSTILRAIRSTGSLNCTIWTAEFKNPNKVVIGTNLGAALVDLETERTSWICRSKSDVLAQQLDQSGSVVLCGLRNGAILMVDPRERREGSGGLASIRIPYSPLGKSVQNSSKKWFELRGNVYPSSTIYMPSSICSLMSLQTFDQYFLASSMDGSVKLYDHRLTKRGALQSFEGLVNSHSRIQLGVDESERFVMAGGEDFKLRVWSLKSGELVFNEKISDSVPLVVSCGGAESSGTWFGSQEGLYNMKM